MDRKDERTKMPLGLAHDRIITLGMEYIQRGWLTDDEFKNLNLVFVVVKSVLFANKKNSVL